MRIWYREIAARTIWMVVAKRRAHAVKTTFVENLDIVFSICIAYLAIPGAV